MMVRFLLAALCSALCYLPLVSIAARLSPAEIGALCVHADGAAHCGRLIETAQLQRLPGLARRDGANLLVSLYPQGTATFTDVDDALNARSYSLWESLDAINAVLLYTTTNDATLFTLLQRRTNRRFEFPAEPVLSPDRQRLVTADVCRKGCSNEIVVWRFSGDSISRELAWPTPAEWSDAAASWKDGETLHMDYSAGAQNADAALDRKLTDPAWTRVPAPR
ncbi:MAG: hypothetical protein ABI981_08245 [Betaproteobacteria bacterium]